MIGKRFRKEYSSFEILYPHIFITKNMAENIARLQENDMEYQIVKDGYLCFRANVFSNDAVISVGLHYDDRGLQFIELFRPKEYYTEKYDIDASFADFNDHLISRYGKPIFKITVPTRDTFAGSLAKWRLRGMKIEHWIMDRFGPEERLHIYL